MCSGSACQQRAIKTEVVDSRDGRGTYLGVELSLAPRTYTDLLWYKTYKTVTDGGGWRGASIQYTARWIHLESKV
jgi:hypothetical protein